MPDNLIQDRWISLQEACDYLGVKCHTIMHWIEQRNIPASKVVKRWRFNTLEVDKSIRSGGSAEEQEAAE